MIQSLILQHWGKEYATKYISERLNGLGLSHKKMELFSHREDIATREKWKNETWPKLVRKAQKEGAVILYEDESTLLCCRHP
ncbi:MAG: hypothetical protein IV090_21355 [Candidatus Sericytochromatia bacterium]|nr:hypothetical protein [Candidatus Sericytochromatia bacterium]